MSNVRILIVEDEPIVAQDIQISLEKCGYEACAIVSTGEDAIKKATAMQPDIVIMDIKLDGLMDGIEASTHIWNELNIPIIYLTAHSDTKTLNRAKLTKPHAYLLKPFDERELFVTIEIALSKQAVNPLFEMIDSPLYQLTRKMIAAGNFSPLEITQWPGFITQTEEKAISVTLQLCSHPNSEPSSQEELEQMKQLSHSMNDLTVDVLDILIIAWLKQALAPNTVISLTAEDCLRFRKLKQKKSGQGRRGGYEKKWKDLIAQQIEILSHIWLSIEENGDLKDYPLIICSQNTDQTNPYQWQVRPGGLFSNPYFSSNRLTTLLSQQILEYDPYRQTWEKRLGRFFSEQWRKRYSEFSQPIHRLLSEINGKIDAKNPIRTKERLESALNTLFNDKVIGKWHYLNHDQSLVGKKGWLEEWQQWKVNVECPEDFEVQFDGLNPENNEKLLLKSVQQSSLAFIKLMRKERGLSQMQVAKEMKISQSRLSQIESGLRPDSDTLTKVRQWLIEQI